MKMTVGVTFAMFGFGMYSRAKIKPAQPEAVPSTAKQAHNVENGTAFLAKTEQQ